MPDTPTFRASDLKRTGPVFDAAQRGRVRITRHSMSFLLVEETQFRRMMEEAADTRPKTLEDLVAGHDKDEARQRLSAWMSDEPSGGRKRCSAPRR